MKRKLFSLLLVCVVLAGFSGALADSTFPSQTITIICPYGAGGGTDVILRALASSASKIAGVNIIVENVTGGNGATGVVTMMAAEPDGYTIGSVSGEWVSIRELGLAPDGFDPGNAEQLIHYNFDPACYVVPIDSPYQTLEDLVTAAKADPGAIVMGVTTVGGSHHLTTLLFENRSGASFNVIPYSEGASATLTALLRNEVEVACVGPAEAAAQVDAGNLKILAIASSNRLKNYPDIPTLKECGYDMIYGSWRALAAPKGTPEDVQLKLEEIFFAAAQSEEFVSFCDQAGFVIDLLDHEAYMERLVEQEALCIEVCQLYLNGQ